MRMALGPSVAPGPSKAAAVDLEARVDLKAAAKATEEKTWKGENALHTAALTYSDVEAYYKQNIISCACAAVARWSGQSNKRLRSGEASLQWELEALNGALFQHLAQNSGAGQARGLSSHGNRDILA